MQKRNIDEMTEEELRRNFYYIGSEFFSWNAGKNTPNILLQLTGSVQGLQARTKEAADMIESLRDTVKEASNSPTKLAAALNKFTLALMIVGVLAFIIQAASMWSHH